MARLGICTRGACGAKFGAPALPDRRIPGGRRGRVGGESRQCYAKGRLFSCPVDTIRIGKGDTHIHVKASWAVPNKIPPINISPQQPPRCTRVCSGPYLRHAISLMQHTASTIRTCRCRSERPPCRRPRGPAEYRAYSGVPGQVARHRRSALVLEPALRLRTRPTPFGALWGCTDTSRRSAEP
jgi:hypothetical protein